MSKFISNIKQTLFERLYPLKPFSEKKPFKSYREELSNQLFSIYSPKKEKIIAAHQNTLCTQLISQKNVLFLYPDARRDRYRHKIVLCKEQFPGLIEGSNIQLVLLLPYIDNDNKHPKLRLNVITDRCQVYYNNPNGKNQITQFRESLIWDLPGNKYPSQSENCEDYEYYNPFLPSEVYEYHPADDRPKKYCNITKAGTEEVLSRFYFPKRSSQCNPFSYMGGWEPDPIMNFVGTYCANISADTATRIVAFATTDGGENWFAKYEFNDSGKDENYGNEIINHKFPNVWQSIDQNLFLAKREFVAPANGKLQLKRGNQIPVKTVSWSDSMELTCAEEHGLQSGEIVTLIGNSNDKLETTLLNNEFAENNFGNGLFYKVKVINPYKVLLFECVSKSKVCLPARHIHSINRVKDGWTLATGEFYPEGWLLMINVIRADNWGEVSANNDIDFIRLNTGEKSIQRILGATIICDSNNLQIVYASDGSKIVKDRIKAISGDTIRLNSIGIYKGKLSDADDFSKYDLLEEVKEPSYFFKELDGCYVFFGQRGELALGFEHGKLWKHGRLDSPLVHYMGRTKDYFVIDGKLLRLK